MTNNTNLLEYNDKVLEFFGTKILDKRYYKREANIQIYFGKECLSSQILPEVLQLYMASYFAKDAFGVECHSGQFRKIKFSNLIKPNKTFQLKLELGKQNINYTYFDDEIIYSSGQLPTINHLRNFHI